MSKERREYGTGRIYKPKGCKFWYVRYNDPDGKKRSESTRSEKRSDAERLLRDRLGRKDRGDLIVDARKVKYTDLVDMIKDDYRANQRKSLKRVEGCQKHLTAFFGSFRALDITTDRINKYIKVRREEGAAPATIQNELAILKRMFNLAVQAGRLPQRPHVPSIKVSNARQGFFEAGDFKVVLSHLPEYLRGPMEFAYLTGWRVRSEVLPLTWKQVDFKAGIVRLEPGTTKNQEGRTFPFGALPQLEALLKAQRESTKVLERETGQIVRLVFHHRGRRIRDYYDAWRTACEKAGVAGRIVHDLRRTAVRNLERAGVPRSVAMKLTGHKTESVYRRYAIVSEGDLCEGVAKLASLQDSGHRDVLPLPTGTTGD